MFIIQCCQDIKLLEILITSESFIPLLYQMCQISESLSIHVIDFIFWVSQQQQLPSVNTINNNNTKHIK